MGGQRRHNLVREGLEAVFTLGVQAQRGEWCMGLIPWRAVRARVLAVAVVEHGKVWAGSESA